MLVFFTCESFWVYHGKVLREYLLFIYIHLSVPSGQNLYLSYFSKVFFKQSSGCTALDQGYQGLHPGLSLSCLTRQATGLTPRKELPTLCPCPGSSLSNCNWRPERLAACITWSSSCAVHVSSPQLPVCEESQRFCVAQCFYVTSVAIWITSLTRRSGSGYPALPTF